MTRQVYDPELAARMAESEGLRTLQLALAQLDREGVPMPLTVNHPGGTALLTRGTSEGPEPLRYADLATFVPIVGRPPKHEDVIALPSGPEPFHGRVSNCHLCRDCPCALDPEPDELTVDDVLAFVERVIDDDEVMFSGGWTIGADHARGFAICDGDGEVVFTGSPRAVLTEAKRRGMLG